MLFVICFKAGAGFFTWLFVSNSRFILVRSCLFASVVCSAVSNRVLQDLACAKHSYTSEFRCTFKPLALYNGDLLLNPLKIYIKAKPLAS